MHVTDRQTDRRTEIRLRKTVLAYARVVIMIIISRQSDLQQGQPVTYNHAYSTDFTDDTHVMQCHVPQWNNGERLMIDRSEV